MKNGFRVSKQDDGCYAEEGRVCKDKHENLFSREKYLSIEN